MLHTSWTVRVGLAGKGVSRRALLSGRAAIRSSTGTVDLRAVLYAAGVVKDVLDGLFALKAVSWSCGLLMDLHYRRGWVWALGCWCFMLVGWA